MPRGGDRHNSIGRTKARNDSSSALSEKLSETRAYAPAKLDDLCNFLEDRRGLETGPAKGRAR